ncbi:peroxiredoxin [Acetobacter estunensis]|uniref:peroxiredoxin n=1 Tax=Acetobacter estunensis TaxID=104097 RepID=UPI001C2DDA5D|nr:peroxiredoxin [Acetobacter estunensis]MBV1836660.1 peroxiredoxin [Acetobacter estunensis]
MRKRFVAVTLLTAGLGLSSAQAALPVGHSAPAFTLPASVAGHAFTFSLKDALRKGPVVVYFYPAAFTPGCTIEAHDFADAMDRFHALGATVIGVSMDDLATVTRFSISACRSRFAVAADTTGAVASRYDARKTSDQHAQRVSYVIAPDGRILSAHQDRAPDSHIETALATLEKWKTRSGH